MSKKKILIVDDEENFSYLLKIHFESTGDFEVYTASNGNAGIKLAKEIKPDLFLLDIMMPGEDGYEVLKKVKKDNDLMMIPVIMLTAVSDEKSKVKAAQLYDEAYITKPADFISLKDTVERILRKREGKI